MAKKQRKVRNIDAMRMVLRTGGGKHVNRLDKRSGTGCKRHWTALEDDDDDDDSEDYWFI